MSSLSSLEQKEILSGLGLFKTHEKEEEMEKTVLEHGLRL